MTAAPHLYAADRVYDHNGRDRCAVCGLGRDWGAGAKRHELPDTPPEAAAVGARMLGEARV